MAMAQPLTHEATRSAGPLLMILGSIVVAATIFWTSQSNGRDAQGTLAGLVLTGGTAAATQLPTLRARKRHRVSTILDDLRSTPWGPAAVMSTVLLTTEMYVGFVFGLGVGTGNGELLSNGTLSTLGLVLIVVGIFTALLMAKYVTQRGATGVGLCLTASIVVYRVVSSTIGAVSVSDSGFVLTPTELAIGNVLWLLALGPAAVVGWWWGKRARTAFQTGQLVAGLPEAEQADVIDLIIAEHKRLRPQ